jgi:hypothetical protein
VANSGMWCLDSAYSVEGRSIVFFDCLCFTLMDLRVLATRQALTGVRVSAASSDMDPHGGVRGVATSRVHVSVLAGVDVRSVRYGATSMSMPLRATFIFAEGKASRRGKSPPPHPSASSTSSTRKSLAWRESLGCSVLCKKPTPARVTARQHRRTRRPRLPDSR